MADEGGSNESRRSLHVVIPPDLKQRLHALAKDRGTAIGFQIANLIEAPLKQAEAEMRAKAQVSRG